MAREGVGIKVKIGLRANGHADHPNWGLLPMVKGGTTPESQQIVKWKYDKTSGHDDDNGDDSPVGMQWGMMIVTEQFANEAVATFPPGIVTIMTEAEAEAFWDDKAHTHVSENQMNSQLLSDLNTELQLHINAGSPPSTINALKVKAKKALNPNDKEPGIKKHKHKKLADAKGHFGFTIKP
ncbi:MAG: hypothetical protein HOK67_31625 [Deltaproteobacteria bacterium]|jgi:hypothetical protein|nr:hypothetical protein [Deltaproteobacteria bacterium]